MVARAGGASVSGPAVQPVLPAPGFRRAGDLVFISSIFPIDGEGNLAHTSVLSPYAGESEVAAQTRSVLETLKRVLGEAGTSLENMVKAEVYLADVADFYEFKLVWKEYFPQDPPARATSVVGEDHIIPGCLLNLNGVALAGDSSWKRETISVPDAPDPMDAEWAPQATKAGPFVFPSTLPATDFKTGVPVGKLPVYPYYGSDAEMQTRYILENLEKVLKAAGSGLDQAVKAQFHETDLINFHDIDGIWGQMMGDIPPTRSSMAMRSLLVPGAMFAANLIFLAPDAQHQKVETRKGIAFHPVDVRKVNYSPGITAGDWLFTAGQVSVKDYAKGVLAIAPQALPHYYSDIEIQTNHTMNLLKDQLTANGYSLVDIAEARIFLTNATRDYRGFERSWRKIFEGVSPLPAMCLIPSNQSNGLGGVMLHELIIEIDLIMKSP
ncbi:MAG: hypothetical protein GEU28_03515 [Dehalococcoidia bacterium]|nr:hypothetical protein [Dehalococcoidia bacterium]